jgi:hypothetical protein
MAASQHLNAEQSGPMQLPMFMRASDYVDSLTGTIDSSDREISHVLYQKVQKAKMPKISDSMTDLTRHKMAHGTGVYDDVEQHGVLNPVQMVHGMNQELLMGQGGHRAASAFDIAERTGKSMWLPVIHTDAREGSQTPVSLDPLSHTSGTDAKKAALKDAWTFSEHTPAYGEHMGWRQKGRELL